MKNAPHPLDNMQQTLTLAQQGRMPSAQLVRAWRLEAAQVALPERYGQVLNGLLDRLESSGLFTEESCSFSQKDQLDALGLWLDKARQQAQRQASPPCA